MSCAVSSDALWTNMQTACALETMTCPQTQSKTEPLKLQTQLIKCAQKPCEDAAKDLDKISSGTLQ